MSATAQLLPLIDEPRPPAGFAALWRELQPRPARLANTLRQVALVLAVVAIGETFRMPEIAVSAYVVLFVSREEQASTVMTAAVVGVAVLVAVILTIIIFMASLSEPTLRVPLIAAATFAAIFLARVSPLGPAAFAIGFIVAYGLTIGDQLPGLSLQASAVSNTTGPGVPALLSIPPEEALLHFLLWLALVVGVPVLLVVLANLITGQRPMALLRAGLAERLTACAQICAGEAGDHALFASARAGSVGLEKLRHLAGAAAMQCDYASLIRHSEQLALALLVWPAVGSEEDRSRALRPFAAGLFGAASCLRGEPAAPIAPAVAGDTADATRPLVAEVAQAAAATAAALTKAAPAPAAKPARRLISEEAVRNAETTRFALKVTLAVMLSYAAENLLDWPEIHTCVVTCFFVSLGTVGESVHKATLRITGALIGGALGILCILVLMPRMTDLGELLLVIGAVTFLAGWVSWGSERISYAGWQIGLAFYLAVLQGYGPTLDMQTARDRVIGILLGNLIVLVVFTTLWPVSVASAAREHVAVAIDQLAGMMRLSPHLPEDDAAAGTRFEIAFGSAIGRVRALIVNAPYEQIATGAGGRRPVDAGSLAALEGIMLILRIIVRLGPAAAPSAIPEPLRLALLRYYESMAAYLDRCADWVRGDGRGGFSPADIPRVPALDGGGLNTRLVWYRVLDDRLHAILPVIGPEDRRGR